MLKKSPPEWNSTHTEAVQQLKRLSEKLSPLQIPGPGKRILQTDASDEYWVAALFEEIDGKRNICGYKSGAFKRSELHYHSTFKEILAVKHGIEKFQFHLLGHNFLVEMDMSSFPKMLQFKLNFFQTNKFRIGLLEDLRIVLQYLTVMVDEAEEKQNKNPVIKLWLDELQDVVYHTEDLVDEMCTESLRHKLDAESQTKSSSLELNIKVIKKDGGDA